MDIAALSQALPTGVSLVSSREDPVGTLLSPHKESECLLLTITKGTNGKNPIILPLTGERMHLTVLAEANTSAMIHVEVQEDVTSCDVEVFLENGARLTILTTGIAATIRQRGRVGMGAQIRWQNVTSGIASTAHDLVSCVEGEGGESSIDWAFLSCGDVQQQLKARTVYRAREGKGEMVIKGIARDQAHVFCEGVIEIEGGAQGTETYLTEDILVLDKEAKVDAVPGLEIRTDDVRASHSASVERISDADLFYFSARGVGQEETRRMYSEGFLRSLIEGKEHALMLNAIEQLL